MHLQKAASNLTLQREIQKFNMNEQIQLDWEDEKADDQRAREVSTWALVTLLFGLLAVLCLFSLTWAFMAIPAFLFGLATWHQCAARPGHWLGTWAAWLGIGLTIFFLSAAFSYKSYVNSWYAEHARQTAEQWLVNVQAGRPGVAFELMQQQKRVLLEGTMQQLLQEQTKLKEKYDATWKTPVCSELLQVGVNLSWRYTGGRKLEGEQAVNYALATFDVSDQTEPTKPPKPVSFFIEHRRIPIDGTEYWTTINVSNKEGLNKFTATGF